MRSHSKTYHSNSRGPAVRPQPLTEQERKALVREAFQDAEAIIAQAFRLAPMPEIMMAQVRVRKLVVKEAARRELKAVRRKSK